MKTKNPYEKAYQIAIEELTRRDLEEVAFNSSVRLEGETLIVPALGQSYKIEARGRKISRLLNGNEPKIAVNPVRDFTVDRESQDVSNGVKIILLHYLITADGTALRGEELSFENIPGGGFYYPTFKKRTIDQLISAFQNDLTRLIKIGRQFGGKLLIEEEPNDRNLTKARIKFFVLPNVPVSFIYWRGQEELSPALQILFDVSVTHYLPLEDIVVVTEILTHRLVRSKTIL